MLAPQPDGPVVTRVPVALLRLAAALMLAAAGAGIVAPPAAGASNEITLEPRALLAGHVRAGAWAGVVVTIRNSGPGVTGELRLSSGAEARTAYGTLVDLPTGSVKEYVLYAQPAIFRTKLDVTLISGGSAIATASVPIVSHDPYTPVIGVVAERPQAIIGDATRAARPASAPNAAVVSLVPTDLPARVEGWSGIDRLVWQDVDAGQLSADQLRALTTWLGAGGRLVILGGTTGTTTLAAFPDELLPFRPTTTIDAPPEDLADVIGAAPEGAESLPALSGELTQGVALARSGNRVVAAQARIGQGSVTLIGFDPGAAWLRETPGALALWRRLLPTGSTPDVNPLALADDSQIVSALTNNLPAAELPRLEQLFALLGGYIVLIGPINYLVLRRLDRREWAWLTMPLLVIVFSVGSWTLGRVLKGTDVIVNQVAIVRGAPGTETGVAQVYIGVFSPTRRQYDVGVGSNALLSNPISMQSQGGTFEQPLDVLQGETARLRGYSVGFGSVRGFRAETAAPAPRVTHTLRYVDGHLRGEIRNESEGALEAAAVVFGGSVARLNTIGPGESREIDLRIASGEGGFQLSERILGSPGNDLREYQRTFTRRAVIDQLSGYGKLGAGTGAGDTTPLFVAWQPRAPLDVHLDVDPPPQVVGDTMYVVPLPASLEGAARFPDSLLQRTVLDTDAAESAANPEGIQLSRGTATLEFRPPAFDGRFVVESLSLQLTQGGPLLEKLAGDPLEPLPEGEQPDQEDPVGEGVPGLQPIPAFQLWDRASRRWVEFPTPDPVLNGGLGENRTIADPERYVDESGAFLVRFVNRGEAVFFGVMASLEGQIQ